MGLLPLPEMTTAYSIGSTFFFANGDLQPVAAPNFNLQLDEADNNITPEDYLRPLFVTGVPKDVRVLFLDVISREDEYSEFRSIGYFATHFDDTNGSSILVPVELLEQDPRTWLCDNLRQELFEIGAETLREEFSLRSLATYIRSKGFTI